MGVSPTPARQASHRIENSGSAGVIPKIKHRGNKAAGRKRKLNGLSLESRKLRGATVLSNWKPTEYSANGKYCTPSPGSMTMACCTLGIGGNSGDPTESHKEVSKLEQSIIKRGLIDAK